MNHGKVVQQNNTLGFLPDGQSFWQLLADDFTFSLPLKKEKKKIKKKTVTAPKTSACFAQKKKRIADRFWRWKEGTVL